VHEDPLLRDGVRALFQQPAGFWILPKLAGYDEERLLFYLMASAATEKLYCLYPRSDDAGRAQVPSIYLRELSRAAGRDFDADPGEHVPRQPFARLEGVATQFLAPKELSLLAARAGQSPDALFTPLGLDGPTFSSCLKQIPAFRRFGEPGPLDGVVGAPGGYVKRMATRGLSPSALDSFARCPFQFFASRVLGLKEAEEPSERGSMASWVRGKIYHRVLQIFYERLKAANYWKASPQTPWEPALGKAVDEAFKEFHWQEMGVYPLLWESQKQKMAGHLRRFAAADVADVRQTGLVPTFFEEALQAPAGGNDGLLFQGRPDRVDRDEKGNLRVVDYKSRWPSSRPPLEKLVMRSLAHQPPVYLELVQKSPRLTPGATPLGAFYYILEESPESTGGKPVQPFPAATWRNVREALLKNIRLFVRHMEEGKFIIIPNEEREGHCQYCSFALACRKSHGTTRHRAENSAQRKEYERLGASSTGVPDAAPAFREEKT